MLLRRAFLTVCSTAILAALPGVPSPADAAAEPSAARFIRAVGTELTNAINGPGSEQEKSAALARIVDQHVDVSGIARFCLGRFWRMATPAQQRQYEDLFHKVLVMNITAKIGEYQGVQFSVGRTQHRAEGEIVATVITRPNAAPADVSWVVQMDRGDPKIIDVIAEGTSLRVTQRSDYASFITRHNDSIAALLAALQRQVSQNS